METTETAVDRSLRWYEVWRDVYLYPSEKTFIRILSDPAVSLKRAYLWVAVTSVVMGVYGSIQPTTTSNWGRFARSMIATPIIACIIVTITAGIYHWGANILGGRSDYKRMLFAWGAIVCPANIIITNLVILLSSYAAPIILVIYIYVIYLAMQAIKAVAQLNTNKALILAAFPYLLIMGLAACVIFIGS